MTLAKKNKYYNVKLEYNIDIPTPARAFFEKLRRRKTPGRVVGGLGNE
jgi:hypothetical protein